MSERFVSEKPGVSTKRTVCPSSFVSMTCMSRVPGQVCQYGGLGSMYTSKLARKGHTGREVVSDLEISPAGDL